MILHYFKLAIRNLIKYKSQSIISILGLAIGFTSFALSTLWIRYERTYDTFHEGAERIYQVRMKSSTNNNGVSDITPFPLSGYLKATFPEIVESCNMRAWKCSYKYNKKKYESFKMDIDSAAFDMFKLQIIAGSPEFMQPGSNRVAITEQLAKQLLGNEDPMGKEIDLYNKKYTICALVKSWSSHSNMPFGILTSNDSNKEWNMAAWQTYIKLKEGTDPKVFLKKLQTHTNPDIIDFHFNNIEMTLITAKRYDRPGEQEPTVKYEHILLFASAGGLIILCALFNYLTLFITRLRMRSREVALRKVCGSSSLQQLMLLATEYIITLLAAIGIGLVLVELVLPGFKELSEIKLSNKDIYGAVFLYSGIVAVSSFFFSLLPIYYFKNVTLNSMLKGKSGKNRNQFQQVCLVLQLVISLCFIFCSVVLIKQLHHLNQADFGLERTGRASIITYPGIDGLREEMARIPFITEIFPDHNSPIFPQYGRSFTHVDEWDGQPDSTASVMIEQFNCNRAYFDFYKFQLLEGRIPQDGDENHILVNQACVKALGIDNPIGKTLKKYKNRWVIEGVVKDFYIVPPTVPCKPSMFIFEERGNNSKPCILFKYQPGHWKECEQRLKNLIMELAPDAPHTLIDDMEENYQKFLKSENALLMMLDIATVVCVLISLFGVFSLVTLDCEKRRKEIAIRKVNGAETSHIMKAFLLKYMSFLVIASAIAFPVGYLIMKPWIESYVLQTTIDFWIYPAIGLSLALLIILSTGWRIWNAANQNPAEVIKNE